MPRRITQKLHDGHPPDAQEVTENDLQHQVRATHLPTHRRLGGQALRTGLVTGSVHIESDAARFLQLFAIEVRLAPPACFHLSAHQHDTRFKGLADLVVMA